MDLENSIDLHAPTEISPCLDRESITFMASMLNAGDVCDITLGYTKQTLANIAAVLAPGVVCRLSRTISTTKLMVFIRHLSNEVTIIDEGHLSSQQHKHMCQSAKRYISVNENKALKPLPINLPEKRFQVNDKTHGQGPLLVSSQSNNHNSQQTTYHIMMMEKERDVDVQYRTNSANAQMQIDFDQLDQLDQLDHLGWRAVDQMMAQHVADPFLCDVAIKHDWQDSAVCESDEICEVFESDYLELCSDLMYVEHDTMETEYRQSSGYAVSKI